MEALSPKFQPEKPGYRRQSLVGIVPMKSNSLSRLHRFVLAAVLGLVPLSLLAEPPPAPFGKQVSATGIRHSFLIAGSPTVLVGEDGQVKWRTAGKARDAFVLANGNVLTTINNQAKEITAEGKVVWSYKLGGGNKELGTAVRLKNGNTLVVERGAQPRLLEVTAEGAIAVTVPLQPESNNVHLQTRMARKLPNGNYLVPHLLAFAVKEYQPDGTVVRTIKTDLKELGGREAENWPFTAKANKCGTR